MRIAGGGDAVTYGSRDRMRSVGAGAGHDPGGGGVLVAGVFAAAVGDQGDAAQLALVAIGLGASLAACGAVSIGVCRIAAVGARTVPGGSGAWDGDPFDPRQHCAAALTEPVGVGHDDGALWALDLAYRHNRVLGRIAFAFSTNAIRSHISVVWCARSR